VSVFLFKKQNKMKPNNFCTAVLLVVISNASLPSNPLGTCLLSLLLLIVDFCCCCCCWPYAVLFFIFLEQKAKQNDHGAAAFHHWFFFFVQTKNKTECSWCCCSVELPLPTFCSLPTHLVCIPFHHHCWLLNLVVVVISSPSSGVISFFCFFKMDDKIEWTNVLLSCQIDVTNTLLPSHPSGRWHPSSSSPFVEFCYWHQL